MTTAKKILLHEKAIKLLHINEQLKRNTFDIIAISNEELNVEIEKRKRLVKKALIVNEKQYKIVLKQLNNE